MKKRGLILVVTVLTFSVCAGAFFGLKKPFDVKTLWVERSLDEAKKEAINIPSLAPLVEAVEGAVLVVTTESVVKQQAQRLPPGFEDSPFRDFFNFGIPPGRPQEFKARGQGSGFIIHPSGFALTNQHVVDGATKIKIKVGEGLKEYDAEVVGSDENTDVALIKIKSDRKDWPVVPLGKSDLVKVGDPAVAIGNPFGLELTVSFGIISARGRRDINPSGRKGLYDFFQTDASINPGNSGGPLLNLAGEVIGINTAISASGQGIAFAIPIDQVKRILPQLKETGTVSRSWLGVGIQDVPSDAAKALSLENSSGALVRQVMPGSPSQKAGVEAGDVIVEFDAQPVKDAASLQVMAGLYGAGKTVTLKVIRNGKPKELRVNLEEMPSEDKVAALPANPKGEAKSLHDLGISIGAIDGKHDKLRGEKGAVGVRIVDVARQSPAAQAGLEPNDIIVKINGVDAKSVKIVTETLEKAASGDVLSIFVRRGHASIFVLLQKP